MVPEYWKICFSVKGLRAPDEILLDYNILIKGTPHDDAVVYFKVTVSDEKEKNNLRDNMIIELNHFLQMYGLITNNHTHAGSVHNLISARAEYLIQIVRATFSH